MSKTDERMEGEIRRLRLEPGDILVFRVNQHLTREARECVKEMMMKATAHLSEQPRIVVLEGGASLEILSKADQQAA